MKARAHVLLLILLVASLSLNLLGWSGLCRNAEVGPLVRDAVVRESPLIQTYVAVGDVLALIPGIAPAGSALAEYAFGATFATIKAEPRVALEVLDRSGHGIAPRLLAVNTLATPVLFVAWLIAFLMRPRQVATIKRRR
jgi:hypothetical protein